MSKCKYFYLDISSNGKLDFHEKSGIEDLFFLVLFQKLYVLKALIHPPDKNEFYNFLYVFDKRTW
jgi:hypothetical protein